MDTGFTTFFDQAARGWLPYILALNVIAGITMALLQTAKDLFPMRRAFQRSQLQDWFRQGADRANEKEAVRVRQEGGDDARDAEGANKGVALPCVSAKKAESYLLALAANDDYKAFFDQQPEDLCGLFNASIMVALDSPDLYGDLLRVTASRADAEDVQIAVAGIPEPMTQDYLDARNRVLHHCQRAIGAFQVDSDFRWKWIMQMLSLLVSTILAAAALAEQAVPVAVAVGSGKVTFMSANLFSVVATSLLAGFLAPVAKDLLAVVQRARGQ